MIEDLRALLAQGNIVLTDEAQERLLAYHRLLLEWNARMDLTNVPEEEMEMCIRDSGYTALLAVSATIVVSMIAAIWGEVLNSSDVYKRQTW